MGSLRGSWHLQKETVRVPVHSLWADVSWRLDNEELELDNKLELELDNEELEQNRPPLDLPAGFSCDPGIVPDSHMAS